MDWLNQLPLELKHLIETIVLEIPKLAAVFDALYTYARDGPDAKRRKVNGDASQSPDAASAIDITPDSGIIHLTAPIAEETIIFDIQQVLFQHPVRKKLNFCFHLIEHDGQPCPVLLIVNPTTLVPELLAVNLPQTIELALLLPIVGGTTKKKSLVLLCLWIADDRMDEAYKARGGDPIVCQVNFEQIKKILVKAGKMPSNIESQFADDDEDAAYLHPIQEQIVNYFTRQFKLCGVELHNLLPCKSVNRFNLNTDQAIAMAPVATPDNNLVIMVECHKGSKDGILVFLLGAAVGSGYIIFGFKKPILKFTLPQVQCTSYTSVTRLTFSLNITFTDGKTIEFSMIDQQFFAVIDAFIKQQLINDASFDAKLKEKPVEGAAAATIEDSDDEEEDGDFEAGDGHEEVAEEFDSGHESGSDDDGVRQTGQEEEV